MKRRQWLAIIAILILVASSWACGSSGTSNVESTEMPSRASEIPAETAAPAPTRTPKPRATTWTNLTPLATEEEVAPTEEVEPTEEIASTEEIEPTAVSESTEAPEPTETPKLTDTPSPTDTPKPTSSPEPTEKIVPTKTPGTSDLEILSHTSYEDSGWFHIVGEVRNNADQPMEFVKIVVTLYDDDDKVVGTDFTYTELDIIPPGSKSPFETGTDEWEGTTHYKLQVQGRAGDLPRQDLVIRSHNSYIDGDWLHVVGEVENTGDVPAEFVKIVITFYDAAGTVIGMDFTYTDLDIVSPGETSPFESGTDHWPGFDHYEIYVQGR